MKHVILFFSLFWSVLAIGQTKSLSDDLIFSFPMDGTATDVSGNSRNGTIVGAVAATTDRFGNPSGALQFNSGTSNTIKAEIDLAYSDAIGTSDFTISFWVLYGTTNNTSAILSKSACNVGTNQFHVGGYGPWGNMLMDNNDTKKCDTINYSPNSNQWLHYLVVRNGANLSVYINGTLLRTKTGLAVYDNQSMLPYRIGAADYSRCTSTYFNGKLDDLRMYSRALTASEIASLYNSDYLQAYYPLNGDAKDYSGNKFDGTMPVSNLTVVDDRFGNPNSAYYFSGGNSTANIIKTTAKQVNVTNYSVSAWVKMASGEYGSIISNRNNGDNTTCAGIFLDVQSNGTVRMGANGWSYLVASQTSATITDNKWHYITGVFSCPSGTSVANARFLIYIDGMPMALTDANGGNRTFQSPISGDGYTYIGESKDVINVFSKTTQGIIDEVKIYNRSLSATDVKRMYADRSAVSTKGLLLYYPLNGDTKDYSGNGLDGTTSTTGVTPALDRFGNASSSYSFGGFASPGAITTSSASADVAKLDFSATDSMSFSCWTNLTSLEGMQGNSPSQKFTEGVHTLFSKNSLFSYWYTNHRISFKDDSHLASQKDDSYVQSLVGQWNHVVLTLTPTTEKIYVNGKLVLTQSKTNALVDMNYTKLTIGRDPGTYSYPLYGSLDEIRLYKRELSQAEIVQLASDKPNTLSQNGAASTIPNPFTASKVFTAEMWVKPNATPAGGFQGFFGSVNGGNSNRDVPCMWVYGNSFHFGLNGNGGTGVGGILPNYFSPNQWTHVAWVSDGSICSFYKNGELQYTCPMTVTGLYIPTTINLGSADGTTLVGQLDEVRVWSTARTQQEIKDNMYKELGAVAGLSASYSFTGSMKNSATSNSGTLNSTAQLVIGSALRTVFMQPATNITAAGFTANWCAMPSSTGYQLQYSNTADFTSAATLVANTNSLPISGVDSVYLRVRAIFAAGDTTAWSAPYRASRLFAPAGLAVSLNPTNKTSDVTSQYVKVPSSAWFKNDFTVSTWVYIRNMYGYCRIFDFGNGSDIGSDNVLFDPIRGILDVYNGASSISMIVPAVPTGKWVNVAITQTNGLATIYYDGVAQKITDGTATQKAINKPTGAITNNNYIGRSNWSTEKYLNMMLDEFCIYNKALTQAEVQTRMYQHLSGSEEGLMLYYDFDNINGTTVNDRSNSTVKNDGLLIDASQKTVPSLVKSTVFPVLAASNVTASSFTANWTAMVGATGYEVQMASKSDFSNASASVTVSATNYTVTPSFSPVYFRVRAVYGTNTFSNWGTTAYFTAPGNGVDLTTTTAITSSDAAGQHVQVLENTPLTSCMTGSFTIDAWIYPRSYKSFCRLFDFGNRNAQTGNCMVGFWNGSASPFFQIGGKNCVASSVLVPINQWSHIALRYDGVAKQAVFYLNGTVIPTRQDGNNIYPLNVAQTIDATKIGTSYPSNLIGRSNGTDSYTDAIIDEFRVSNQALLQDTIIARSHRHLSGKETDLVLYYDFDQIAGTTIPNLASNSGVAANGIAFNNAAFVASKALVTPFIRTATNKRINGVTANWDLVPGANYQVEFANNSNFTDSKIDSTTNAYYTLTASYSPIYFRVRATAKNVVSEWATTSYMTAPGTGVDLTNTTNLACSNTTGKYVQVPAGKWFQTDFTVDGWINLKDYKDKNWIRWFDFGLGQDNSNVLFGLNATDNKSYSSTRNGATPSDHPMARIPLNTWTHVALVMKNNILTVYYNGEQISSDYKANRAPANTVFTSNYIGRSNWVSSNITTELYTNATFDEFRIYNTALSRDSIIARSHRHLKGTEDSLLLYYDFDQISGNVVPNLATKTGVAGNGTIFNNAPLVASKALVTPFIRAASNITVNGFTANWDSVPGTSYKVEYANNSNFTGSTTATTAKPFLTLETNYSPVYFRVQSTIGSLVCEWSATSYFTAPGNSVSLNNNVATKVNTTTGKYISVPSGNWLSPTEFTVDAWVNIHSFKAWSRLFDFGNVSATNVISDDVLFALNQIPSFSFIPNGTVTNENRQISTQLPLNTWTHIAFTFKSKNAKVYINGVKIFEGTTTNQATGISTSTNYLGKTISSLVDEYVDADFDEFRIYNKELTQNQIVERSHKHLDGTEEGLLLYYDFDQINGSTIPNLATKTGAAGNGTIFNNAAFVDSKAMITPFIRKVDTTVANKVTISWDKVPSASYEVQTAQTADFATNYQSANSTTDTAFTATLANNQSVCFYRVRTTAPVDTSAWQTGVVTIKSRGVQNMAYQGAAAVVANTTDIQIKGGDLVTMSCWAKFLSIADCNVLFQSGISGKSGKMINLTGAKLQVLYDANGGAGWQGFECPVTISANTWYHFAYSLDANKKMTMYLNGVKYIPVSNSYGTYYDNTLQTAQANADLSLQPLSLGSANCTIDNFQIWKAALSQDDIIKYANTPVKGTETNLAVAYNFNQIDGTNVSDLSTSTATPATVVNNPLLWKASNAELTPLVRITAANDSSLTVGWGTVPGATSYKLKYATKADLSDAQIITQKESSKLFDKLIASTNYYFSAKAITTTDSSDWSVPVKGSLLGLNDSLVSFYPFNNSTVNASGTGSNLKISSTGTFTYEADRLKNVAQAIAIPTLRYLLGDRTSNNLTGSFTNIAWIKLDSLRTKEMGIISKYGASGSDFSGYFFAVSPQGKLYTAMGDAASFKEYQSTATIPLNAWTCVAQQYNAQTKELKMFVNNQLAGTFTGIEPLPANSYPFALGSREDDNIYLAGKLDDVRQYSRPLSDKELSNLYHEGGWPYTGVALSKNRLTEQLDKGTEVGKLRPQFADGAKNTCNKITYKLVVGVGSTDNDKFIIASDSILKSAFIFDTTKQRTASIRVQAVDCNGITFENIIAINIVGNTNTEVYTFDKQQVTAGDLNNQDDWKSIRYKSGDAQITVAAGQDGTQALVYNESGPGYGFEASKTIASMFPTSFKSLTQDSVQTTLSYDIYSSAWGAYFGLRAKNGKDAFVMKTTSSGDAESFTVLGKQLPLVNAVPNDWTRVAITFALIDAKTAELSVRARTLADANSAWISIVAPTRFAVDTANANTTETNPNLWDSIAIKNYGELYKFDNIAFSKRTVNPSRTGINDGLLAYYNMDNNIRDTSGNHNNGTVNKTTPSPTVSYDRFGQATAAYHFDGTQNFAVTGMGKKLPASNVSFSVWAKEDEIQSSSLFTLGNDINSNRVNAHVLWGGTTMYWDYGNIEAPNEGRLETSASFNTDWHHYVFVSGDNGMKIYIDNALIIEKANKSTFIPIDTALLIGGFDRNDGGSHFFKGSMDDLRIYNRELTSDDIKVLYTEGGWPIQNIKAYDMTLEIGTSGALKMDVTPADAPTTGLIYTSGDTKIATVTNTGVVKGVAEGQALITAATANGLIKSTAVVAVTNTITPITSITLADTAVTLLKGESYTFKYSIYPTKKVVTSKIAWSSTNGFAAPIKNGVLSALAPCSNEYIYVYADSTLKTVFAKCKITILPSALPRLSSDTASHFSLKAIETIGGVQQPKDTLKLLLSDFFVDDSVLTYSYSPILTSTDTIQLTVSNGMLLVYPRDTLSQKQPLKITITAIDVDKQTVSKVVYVQMKSTPDLAPKVSTIAIDTLRQFRKTVSIDLRKYVLDDYTSFTSLVFDSLKVNKRDTASIKNGVVTLAVRPVVLNSNFSDTLRLQVADARKQRSEIAISYVYQWVLNAAPKFSHIDTVKQETSDTTIVFHLNRFVKDDYTPTAKLKWSFEPAQNVNIKLKDSTLYLSASSSAWDGTEMIKVYAQDEASAKASAFIPFRQVVDLNLSGTPIVDFEIKANGVTSSKIVIQRGTKVSLNMLDKSNNTIGIDSWNWVLDGVTPSTINGSTANDIQYNTVGLFDVTLYAINGSGPTKVTHQGAVQVLGIMANRTKVCTDSTATLWASDSTTGNQYQWSTGATTASIEVKPKKDTTISVIITKGTVTVKDTIRLVYVKQLTNVADDFSMCPGDSKEIKPTGFTSLVWNGTPLPSYTATKAEKVVVKASVDKACPEITDQITVTLSAAPKLNMPTSTVTICEGSKDTIVVGTKDGSSFQWNQTAGVVKDTIFANAAGDYIVTATLGTCKTIDTLTVAISELPKVTAFASATNVCQGGLVTLSTDNQQGLTYKWNVSLNADNKATVAAVGNNDYYVTATNSFGCTAWDSVRVLADVPMNVHIQALPNDTLCANSQLTLTATAAKSYSWSNSVTNGQPFVLTVSNTFYVTSTSGNCEQRDSITIVVRENPRVNITALPNSPLCKGDSLTLTADGGKEYKWNGSVTNGKKFAVDQSTNYVVTVSDANNCITEKSIAVFVNSLTSLKAVASDSSICDGDSIRLYGRGAKSYSWSTGLADSSQIKPKSTEITKYTVTGTDADGCKATAEVEVKAIAIPTISIGKSTDTVCKGASKVLSATGTATSGYWWSVTPNGKKSPNDTSVSPDATTRYYVTATSGSCSDTLSKLVIVKGESALKIKLNTATDTAICKGASITLNATTTEVSTISWNNGVTNNVAVTPADTTTYIVTAVDQQKCAIQQSVKVAVRPLPKVVAKADTTTICSGKEVTLTGAGAATYIWSDNLADGAKRLIAANTSFTVTGVDANKCSNIATISIAALKPYKEQLGVVTYNEAGTGLIVAWTPTKGKRTAQYEVLRLNDTTAKYNVIATRYTTDSSFVVDKFVNATKKAYVYRLVTHDSVCNNTDTSDLHRTIHLTNTQSTDAPSKVSLHWTAYQGLNVAGYKIYVLNNGVKVDSLVEATVAGLQSYSQDYDKHQNGYKYRIAFNLPSVVTVSKLKSDSGPFSQSFSNMSEASLVSVGSIHTDGVSVWPVPTKDVLHVTVADNDGALISLFDDNGKQVAQTIVATGAAEITTESLSAGLYLLQVNTNAGLISKKITIVK